MFNLTLMHVLFVISILKNQRFLIKYGKLHIKTLFCRRRCLHCYLSSCVRNVAFRKQTGTLTCSTAGAALPIGDRSIGTGDQGAGDFTAHSGGVLHRQRDQHKCHSLTPDLISKNLEWTAKLIPPKVSFLNGSYAFPKHLRSKSRW